MRKSISNSVKKDTQQQTTADVIRLLNDAEISAQRKVCELVSSIIFNGGFSKPTTKEKEVIALLIKLGFLYPNFSSENLLNVKKD